MDTQQLRDTLAEFDLHHPDRLIERLTPDAPAPAAVLLARAVQACREPVVGECPFRDLVWRIGPHAYGLPWVHIHLQREGDDEWTAFGALAPHSPESLQRQFEDAQPYSAMVWSYLEEQLDDEDRADTWQRMAEDAATAAQQQTDALPIRAQCGAQRFLLEAIEQRDPALLDAALTLGAGLNRPDARGNGTLHQAVLAGRGAFLPALLERGAWIDATNQDGRTPLHLAALAHDKAACKALMDAGADAGHVDAHGQTAVQLAKGRVRGMRLAR